MPALRKGTHEGCPYASWFGGKVYGGDGKPSPYRKRPCGQMYAATIDRSCAAGGQATDCKARIFFVTLGVKSTNKK